MSGWVDVIVIRSNARSVEAISSQFLKIPPIESLVTFVHSLLVARCSLSGSSRVVVAKCDPTKTHISSQIFNRPSGGCIVLQVGENFKRTFAGSSTRHRQRSSGHGAEPARSSAHPAAL